MELTIKQSAINYMNNRMLWGHIFRVCTERLNKAKNTPVEELFFVPPIGSVNWFDKELMDMINRWSIAEMELFSRVGFGYDLV